MSSSTYRAPRHVNLRSQQRRLRHVRSLAVRSLKPLEPVLWTPLSIEVKFTLHTLGNDKSLIYTSTVLDETYNPTWGSLFFSYEVVGENLTLSKFVIKLWLTTKGSNEDILCFEKLVNLSHHSFIGTNICKKDNLTYPINTVIIGTSDGYYCSNDTINVPYPRQPVTELQQFLPRNSLIEVRKSEVLDSYQIEDLKKLLTQQIRLRTLRRNIMKEKQEIVANRLKHNTSLAKREEMIYLQVRVQLLKQQITDQRIVLNKDNEDLMSLESKLNKREKLFNECKQHFKESKTKHDNDSLLYSQRKDLLNKTQRKLYLRQRTLISELAQTFCIKQLNETFTICDVILPHGDPIESGAASADQTGVALGFVSHLVQLMAQFLLIPLQYPIQCTGSKSTIIDNIHIGLDIREFPLYVKGTDKAHYQFGLYLLWRDILQVRQHCGYSNSKSTAKKTLQNLKNLLDKLMMDKYSIFPLRHSLAITSATEPVTQTPISTMTSYFNDEPFFQSPLEQPYENSQDTEESNRGGMATPPYQGSFTDTTQGEEPSWITKDLEYNPRSRAVPMSRSPVLSSSPRKTPESSSQFGSYHSGSPRTPYMVNVARPFSNTDRNFPSLESIGRVTIPLSCPASSSFQTVPQCTVYSTSDSQRTLNLDVDIRTDNTNSLEKS